MNIVKFAKPEGFAPKSLLLGLGGSAIGGAIGNKIFQKTGVVRSSGISGVAMGLAISIACGVATAYSDTMLGLGTGEYGIKENADE